MAKTEVKHGKIETSFRMQIKGYLEVKNKSVDDMIKEIRERTGAKITAATVYNWFKEKSSIKTGNLELLIEQAQHDGVEITM